MTTIQTTMVHARVPVKIRDEAKEVAQELGVSLSLIVEQALRNFATRKKLVIEKPLAPTPYLESILEETEKDLAEGNKDAFSGPFTTDGFIEHLKSL